MTTKIAEIIRMNKEIATDEMLLLDDAFIAKFRRLQAAIVAEHLPLLEQLATAKLLHVAVFPEDNSKYSLAYEVETVCENGCLQLNCYQSADAAAWQRKMESDTSWKN